MKTPLATLQPGGYLTKQEVAALLQLHSIRTVDRYMAAGLPHLKLGQRRVRFKLDDVHEWIERKFRTVRAA